MQTRPSLSHPAPTLRYLRSADSPPGSGGKNEKRVHSPRSIDTRSPGNKKEKFAGIVPSNLVEEFSAA